MLSSPCALRISDEFTEPPKWRGEVNEPCMTCLAGVFWGPEGDGPRRRYIFPGGKLQSLLRLVGSYG